MYSEQGFGELSEPSWAREEKVIRKKLVSKTKQTESALENPASRTMILDLIAE